jgi:UDP-N-acetylmuramyl pentapeptide phosphotransferase/UDP-N-acetylglucosamine-1-phosphate transferase
VTALLVFGGSGGASLALVAVMVALGVVGFLDDRRGLRPILRLLLQLVAGVAVVLIVSGAAGTGARFGALSVAFLIYMVNAFNFMDGINGIAGLHGVLFSVVLAAQFLLLDEADLALVALALAGACAGFLPYNFPNARVFLGDVGSYFVGGLTSGLAILAISHGANWVITVSVFGYYILDTGSTLALRIARRRNLFEAHRDHAYQLLVRSGLSHARTSGVTTLLSASALVVASLTTSFFDKWAALLLVIASIVVPLCFLRRRLSASGTVA